jgi:hypothetical protein
MQQSRDKEVTSLRQQLIDFQAQSDEKTVIGKMLISFMFCVMDHGVFLKCDKDASQPTLIRLPSSKNEHLIY